jgi:hypothetical protein
MQHVGGSPLLASPQGGVAERSISYREASADSEAGVVFRFETRGKRTPSAPKLRRLRAILLMGAATPPCGDARRGLPLACRVFLGLLQKNLVALPQRGALRPFGVPFRDKP